MSRITAAAWRALRESRLLPPLAALGLILLFDLIFVPRVFTVEMRDGHLYGSLVDIVRNGAPIVILAIGMTLVIATGGVDLSVGATMAISSSAACLMMNPRIGQALTGDIAALVSSPNYSYYPLWLVISGSLALAALCGLWNGVLVAYGRMQPMVATLILMIAGRGIAQLVTNAVKVNIFNDTFNQIGNGWLILPLSVYIVALVFIVAWVVTRRTAIGLFIESVGINFRSSYNSGINEKRVKLFAYAFCGLCAGVAGLIVATSVKTSDANQIGLYSELDAILAVVIGGTVMGNGGRFSLMGSILGGLVIQATTTTVYTVGVPASAITAVKAFVVIVVIVIYSEQAQEGARRLTGMLSRRQVTA